MPLGTPSDSEPLVPLRAALPAADAAAAQRWLAALSDDPTGCLRTWADGGLAPVRLGQVAVLRVARVLALELLERWSGQYLAPVLSIGDDPFLCFLVPQPPAGALQLPAGPGEHGHVDIGVELPAARFPVVDGWRALDHLAELVDLVVEGTLMCPAPGALPRRGGPRWLIEPDGRGHVWNAAAVVQAAATQFQAWVEQGAAAESELRRRSRRPVDPAAPEGAVRAATSAMARYIEASRALLAAS
ncbi:hypothetical protein [Kitasatospora griseola]|uniref:hypothetical protein n=1 Tax=Kitasatospora griseola TaxID=2064 RepID=UPI003428F367